jgi:hypothetical protein
LIYYNKNYYFNYKYLKFKNKLFLKNETAI